jgi:hypothetical protein
MLPSALAVGQVYQCEAPDGHPVYQDSPCDGVGEVLDLQVHQPSAAEIAHQEKRRRELREHIDWIYKLRAQQREAARARRAEKREEQEQRVASYPPPQAIESYPVIYRYRLLKRSPFHFRTHRHHLKRPFKHSFKRSFKRSGCLFTAPGCKGVRAAKFQHRSMVRPHRSLKRNHRQGSSFRLKVH